MRTGTAHCWPADFLQRFPFVHFDIEVISNKKSKPVLIQKESAILTLFIAGSSLVLLNPTSSFNLRHFFTIRCFCNVCIAVLLYFNKKAVLSQRWSRDARYISRSWAVVEIYDRLRRYGHLKFFPDGGGRHLGFVRTGNSAIRFAVSENPTIEQIQK